MEAKLTQQARDEQAHAQQAIRRLEDELQFQKRHHEMELNMLKEQYERSLETAKMIAQENQKMS